jgi:hypothetical protein
MLALLACLGACIAIPVKPPPGEKPFKDDFLSFIAIGETTRAEVQNRLESGEVRPRLTRFDDDSVWVYAASRDTWQWLVCAGGGYTADCGIGGGTRDHFLKLEFDEDGKVRNWETSSTLGECSQSGICEEGSSLMVFASAERDSQAKQSKSDDYCAIYVFATLPGGSRDDLISVWIDDLLEGWFVNADGYLFKQVEPGPHRIKSSHSSGSYVDTISGRNSQSLLLNCAAGERHIAHHNARHKEKGGRQFVLELDPEAANAIATRTLILQPIGITESPNVETTTLESIMSRSNLKALTWKIQYRLKEMKLYDGPIDGELSAETEEAIREYKKQNGLHGDTVLDDDTLTALGVL